MGKTSVMVAMMMMVWRNLAIALTIAVPEVSSYPGVLLVMIMIIHDADLDQGVGGHFYI